MKLYHISWIPAFVVMLIIFFFSAKPSDASEESSMAVAKAFVSVYEDATNTQIEQSVRLELLQSIDHFVRKTAHFCEYALLACTYSLHLYAIKRKKKWMISLPILLSFLYAGTDEFHQLFVPGRSGQFSDVVLDTVGGASGTLFFYIIMLLLQRMHQYKKSNN